MVTPMKMHQSVLLLAVLGLVLSYSVTETKEVQESADLVFLIDGSRNLGRGEFQFIRSFIANFIEDLNIGPDAIQVGMVQYSKTPSTVFYLNTYTTKTEVLKAVKNIRQKGGNEANTGMALQFLVDNHFIPSAGSRADEEVPQVMVLLTSRQSSDDVRRGVFSIKKRGTFTFVLGITDTDAAEAKLIATDPSFSMFIPDLHQMASTQQQLMSLFSLVATKQLIIKVEEPKVEVQIPKRDIVFLIDGSSSLGHANFLKICKFISSITENFVIGPDSVQVAVAQYSDAATTEFHLNTHTTQSALQTALKNLRLRGGWTLNTGAALDYIYRSHFATAAGSRKEDGVPQFVVLITGAKSNDDVKQPADILKRSAIMAFALGDRNADLAELNEIAIDPSLVFNIAEFDSLPDIHQQVLTQLSTLAGVTVVYEQPTASVKKEMDKRDIVFLIDGSYNTGRRNFADIRDFIATIITAFDIGNDRVQVGLAQYSDAANSEFFLNTYSSKNELLSHVRELRQRGGRTRKTGEALNYVLKYLFTKYSGSRHEEGVPQFLVLITSGKLTNGVRQPSDALLQAGVITLVIGAENMIKQLQEVSSDPSLAFGVKEFRFLPEIQHKVLLPLSTLTGMRKASEPPTAQTIKDMTDNQERDIVFLIDGSTKAGSSFRSVREFLKGLIEQLNVGLNRNRVAVVQYSKGPKVEFLLNTYSNKDDVLDAVGKLKPMGGRMLNTGAALNYIIRNVFTTAAGSRRDANVPQLLVLLISGKSSDNIKEAAGALKRAAIVAFVIGAMDADGKETHEIAYSSNLLFAVHDFQSLPDIQNELLQPLKTLIVEVIKMPSTVTEGNKRDIVFLVDGSYNVGTFFYLIRDLIINLIPNFNVAKDKDQISVVQYSEDARIEFPLNAYTNKELVLAKTRELRLKGGRRLKTGSALDFVRRNVFSRSGGGRHHLGISQILVLITSGKSLDNVKQPTEELKQAGVVPFVIGIGNVDRQELHQIAYSPSLVFQVDDYWGLSDLDLHLFSISKNVDSVPIPPTTSTDGDKRDIVFLLDGSAKIGKGFPNVRKFMMRMVDNFDAGAEKVQFAAVQFSESPRTEFYLNTHSTKKQVLATIKKLKLKRGKKINIGRALDHVIENVFISSAGSRMDNAVPQILLLLTSGKSHDDISQQAKKLRKLGIVLFAIGLRDADQSVLEPMAYTASLAFPVNSFQGLLNIQDQLQQIVKTVAVQIVETPVKDN
ncbi:collagen alpha-3(VI) chain-like isoform X2 [Rhincodon typus]|uniref:collagen alpha-3(VI) chain-like isoform X2 n=1 Tax=Rhincodon typus TaxID=259920 RepID=UPI00202FFC76|nr:collagen alpha-3(VI) chain-like isoform X2 [Rhincodon typus]